jgi:glycerate 2-kinase
MNILIAMDSFKESLTALEACEAVKKGFKEVLKDKCNITCVPMADGGEGTVQSLVDATEGKIIKTVVTGPLMEDADSFYGILGDGKTAVIEMAAASGIEMVKPQDRNPLITTTFGTGELILKAIEKGVTKIILGIGGSATNDGGVGMAMAIGVKFLDKHGSSIQPVGGDLKNIEKIDMSEINSKIKDIEFLVACDVDNPLTGSKGASAIFGPQKGATPECVKQLDANLTHYAKKVKEFLGVEIESVPGAGAAGGLGGGSIAFLNATLKSGIDIVIEATSIEEYAKSANLVITGEGRIDRQTAFGKTPMGVAKVAKKYNIPVIALAGCLGDGYEDVFDIGIDTAFSILPRAVSTEEAINAGKENLEKAARDIARLIKIYIKNL